MFYKRAQRSFIRLKKQDKDISGGPVAKTPHSQCRGPGFNPCSGKYEEMLLFLSHPISGF